MTALRMVPRLQKKHYEMIPKRISEIDFWVSFFSHMTAIVQAQAPENLAQLELEEWKGKEEGDEASPLPASSVGSFVWSALSAVGAEGCPAAAAAAAAPSTSPRGSGGGELLQRRCSGQSTAGMGNP